MLNYWIWIRRRYFTKMLTMKTSFHIQEIKHILQFVLSFYFTYNVFGNKKNVQNRTNFTSFLTPVS